MRAYVLSIAGAVLVSAVLSIIAPSGRMGKFVKGMTKLFILVVLITPFVTFFRGDSFIFASGDVGTDEGYLERSALLMSEAEAREIEAKLKEEYGIGANVHVTRGTDFVRLKIVVNIYDFGIFGQDEHIDIVAKVQAYLKDLYGCDAEVS